MFVFRMVSQWCQTVWILWYSYVCVQYGFPVMSNCMNIVIFLCLYPGWSLWCQTVWILWYSYVCIQDGLCDVKLYEYCDILMFVSRMVSQWCQTVWILWHSYVCVQDGLPVMSNCMNIVIFLCLYPGWSLWCQTVWILWYSYVCIQDGLCDVKLYEYCDILMFVSRMVSQWCRTVWIMWYSYVCIQNGLSVMSKCMNIVIFLFLCSGWSPSDVKLYEYCDILMFVSRMVSQWCQTVWILWYSYVCIQDGFSVMSNILVFLCLCPRWSQWCQTVWILWYSYVCIQDGLAVMSNCMNIVIFLCLYWGLSLCDAKLYEYCEILMFVSGWSLCDVKVYEYCDILLFVSRMVSLWCQTVWILWYSYVCVQDGLPVMSNCLNIVIFLCLCPGWSLCDVKLYEYYDILMFVGRVVSQWCQTVWILWYSYVCIQDGLPVMSNCMNIVIFLCLYPGWSPSDVKLYEYCDILMFVSRMVSLWCQTLRILWYSYVCV